uniref:LAGLIDADG endonuclease n=1 Tax=Elmerina hispida TaxID=1245649 RepID=UPI0030015785
ENYKKLIKLIELDSLLHDNLNYYCQVSVLPAVGIISPHAFKKGTKKRLDKSEYLNVPYQFIAYLVGLIDGDGYIPIIKTTKGYIKISLVIQLHLDDLSTLEYVNSVLKLGKITISRDHKSPNCKLIINKTDLQDVFFPLMIHHGIYFLTDTRRSQFNLAMYILEKDIKQFLLIPDSLSGGAPTPVFSELPENSLDYLNLKFFKN